MEERKMMNVNANLLDDVRVTSFGNEEKTVEVANFTLVKKYGEGKQYTNCAVYGDKVEIAKAFKKGDFIHVFGYIKEVKKEGKTYKNFIVKSLNKIEKKENKED